MHEFLFYKREINLRYRGDKKKDNVYKRQPDFCVQTNVQTSKNTRQIEHKIATLFYLSCLHLFKTWKLHFPDHGNSCFTNFKRDLTWLFKQLNFNIYAVSIVRTFSKNWGKVDILMELPCSVKLP